MAQNEDLILRGKALKDLRGIKDVLLAQCDPFLAAIMNRAIECIENQPAVAVPVAHAYREPYRTELKPCPLCGVPPHMGYACGEHFIQGENPDCPICGTAFTEMHTDPALEVEAWNRRAACGGE